MVSPKRSTVGRSVAFVAALLTGCNATNPISPPTGLSLGEGDGTIVVCRWLNGPVVVICGDAGQGATSTRGCFSGPPSVWKQDGSASAKDGRKFDWALETADGKTVKCRVAGRDFDLSKGSLFLVTTRGGKTEVEQVDRDVSSVQPTAESCKEFAKKNADVAKLLYGEEKK